MIQKKLKLDSKFHIMFLEFECLIKPFYISSQNDDR